MLEAAFLAWLVALLGDRTVRGITRILLGNPERRRFAAALGKSMDAAIPLAIQHVPAGARDQLEQALSERFSVPPVIILDGRTRVRTALTEAIQQQIAPLADPAITPDGRSFLEEIGVDAAQLRADLAEVAIRCVQNAGPSFPALLPLVTQINADGIVEVGEATAAKIDEILASVERWKQVPAAPYQFPRDTLDRVTDALLAIPAVADSDTRNVILNMLPESLRDSIPRSPVPRVQVYNIVRTCSVHAHGLRKLIDTVRSLERDSLPMRNLEDLILDLGVAADPPEERATS